MEFNPNQQKALAAITNGQPLLVIGGPGTGKTTLLIESAAHLLTSTPKVNIAVLCFAYRTAKVTENLFLQKYADLTKGNITFATMKDLAQKALEQSEEFIAANGPIHFASNNKVRSILRAAMQKTDFKGSVTEAEHIIRTFRAQLKNPAPDARHFPLFESYQTLMEQAKLMDRHTIIRKHVVAVDKKNAQPAPYTHIMVDHIQDATPIQIRWLLAHQAKGAKIVAMGDDDQTLYTTDGAAGQYNFEKLQTIKKLQTVNLNEGYRTSQQIAPAIHKYARMLLTREEKTQKEHNKTPAQIQTEVFTDFKSEWHALTKFILKEHDAKRKTALITRTHAQALRFSHLARLAGLPHAVYARPIWEQNGAQLALSTLYVILGHGQINQLMTLLNAMGVSGLLQATLAQSPQLAGGVATWLQTGLELPNLHPTNAITAEDIKTLRRICRQLSGTWQALQQRKITPKEAFKATMAQMLPRLNQEQQQYALLATDMLTTIKGDFQTGLKQLLTETLPDANAPLVIAPVRETRNMSFNTVILPNCDTSEWPRPASTVLNQDSEHERRLFYMALTRSSGNIIATSNNTLSPYLQELTTSTKK